MSGRSGNDKGADRRPSGIQDEHLVAADSIVVIARATDRVEKEPTQHRGSVGSTSAISLATDFPAFRTSRRIIGRRARAGPTARTRQLWFRPCRRCDTCPFAGRRLDQTPVTEQKVGALNGRRRHPALARQSLDPRQVRTDRVETVEDLVTQFDREVLAGRSGVRQRPFRRALTRPGWCSTGKSCCRALVGLGQPRRVDAEGRDSPATMAEPPRHRANVDTGADELGCRVVAQAVQVRLDAEPSREAAVPLRHRRRGRDAWSAGTNENTKRRAPAPPHRRRASWHRSQCSART